MPERLYHVYIVASKSRVLYIGMTGRLVTRIGQHKHLLPWPRGFASLYHTNQLVYHESTTDVRAAIAREKQLKRWTRKRKLALISAANPTWRDLAVRWPTIECCPCEDADTRQNGSRPVWVRDPSVAALRALPQDDNEAV